MQLVPQSVMTNPVFSAMPAPSNSLLDLNLNINFNPKNMVHDDMYDVKYRQPDTLHESVLFKPIRQITESSAMFEFTSFIDFRPCLQAFNPIEWYINELKEQLTDPSQL